MNNTKDQSLTDTRVQIPVRVRRRVRGSDFTSIGVRVRSFNVFMSELCQGPLKVSV